MARNPSRRASTPGYASTVIAGLLICCSAAISLLGYIRLKDDLNRLERDIGATDRDLARLRRANHKLRLDYEMLVSPSALDQRVRLMGLNLISPREDARVVLNEPRMESPAPVEVSSRGMGVAARDDRLALNGDRTGDRYR